MFCEGFKTPDAALTAVIQSCSIIKTIRIILIILIIILNLALGLVFVPILCSSIHTYVLAFLIPRIFAQIRVELDSRR